MPKTAFTPPDATAPAEAKLDRRSMLAGAALAGLALPMAGAGQARAEHAHHGAKHDDLTRLALECVGHGEACVAHCITVIGSGDTSLIDCLASVNAMLPMCATLARYAATDAKRLTALAKVCIDVCDDCAKECEKHADEHEACKACGDACVACIKACKEAIGA